MKLATIKPSLFFNALLATYFPLAFSPISTRPRTISGRAEWPACWLTADKIIAAN
jgi:hypothetical protein